MSKTRPGISADASFQLMGIGATVLDSPVGPGTVTKFSDAGYPMVNGVSVAWCLFSFGPSLRVFDPQRVAPKEYTNG